jgi:hypothetical protein
VSASGATRSRTEELYRRARRGSPSDVAELIADDATWHGVEGVKWAPCENAEQIVRTLMWRANMLKLAPRETIPLGDREVVSLRGRHLGRLGGKGFWVQRLFQVVTWRGGRVVRIQDYRTHQEALADAGVRR